MPISFLTKGRSRPLKILGFIVAGLLVLLLVIGFFLPSEYKVSRSVVIQAPAGEVFDQVADLRTWDQWTNWTVALDQSLKRQYSGQPGQEGQRQVWSSTAMGSGQMAITYVKRPDFVEYELLLDQAQHRALGYLEFQKAEGGVRVTWTIRGDLGADLPGRYFALFYDASIGDDFQTSLANLKSRLESGK